MREIQKDKKVDIKRLKEIQGERRGEIDKETKSFIQYYNYNIYRSNFHKIDVFPLS